MASPHRRPRHILLYGPPGAGKLTVAEVLAARHGLRLLDNHLTVDVALRLFEFGTSAFGRLVERLRFLLFEAAAGEGVDVVSTLVYAHPDDRPYVTRMEQAAERLGVEVSFVQLRPHPRILEERVVDGSRANRKKVRDTEVLRSLLDRYDLYTPVHDDDISIDNSEMTPHDAARVVAARLGLGAT